MPLWAEYINGWLDSLKAAGYSTATLHTRRCQMTAMGNALGGSPLDVGGNGLVGYFASKEWKPETRRSARNATVSFFRWIRAHDLRDDDPSQELPSVRRPQAHPRPCPDKVILSALSKANDEERLMLRLGAECGLRRSEIASASSTDVMDDLVGRSLIVRGKNDKQRLVPLPDDLADLITAHHGIEVGQGDHHPASDQEPVEYRQQRHHPRDRSRNRPCGRWSPCSRASSHELNSYVPHPL